MGEPPGFWVPDPFIYPEHVCRPPNSRRFGSTWWEPKDLDVVPPGTRWICECGRGYKTLGVNRADDYEVGCNLPEVTDLED